MKPEEIEAWYDAEKEKLFAQLTAEISAGKDRKIGEANFHKRFMELHKRYSQQVAKSLETALRQKKSGKR